MQEESRNEKKSRKTATAEALLQLVKEQAAWVEEMHQVRCDTSFLIQT